MKKDPVCGMDVNPKTVAYKSEFNGQTYYFCCSGCKADFDREPMKFLMPHEHNQHLH